MFKKRLGVVAAAAAVALMTGCASAAEPADGDPVTLRISTWTAEEPGLKDWWPEVISGFEAEHENVTVELQQIPFADYITTLTTQLTAGGRSAPEIIHIPRPTTTLPAWAEAGFLLDLDSFLDDTGVAAEWPSTQGVMAWDGVNYGLLLVDYGYVLYVNEQMLADAGITEIPRTPEEVVAAAKAVTETSSGKFGFATVQDSSPNLFRDALMWVVGTDAPWVEDGAWNLTDPAVVDAFDTWRTLSKDYAPVGTDLTQSREAFTTGNVAMMYEGPFFYSAARANAPADIVDSLRVAVPAFDVTPGDVSHGLSIQAGLGDAMTELAQEFLTYAASETSMVSYSELVLSPVTRPGASDGLRADPLTAPIADAQDSKIPLIDPTLYGLRASYNQFTEIATVTLQQMLSGNLPTAQLLEELQANLDNAGITP